MGKIKLNESRCCVITSSYVSIDDQLGTLVRVNYNDREQIEIEVQGGNNEKYNDEVYEFVKERILNGDIHLPTFVPLEQYGENVSFPVRGGYFEFGGIDHKEIKTITRKKIQYVESLV